MPAQQAVYEPFLPLRDITADGAWSPQIDVRELPDQYIVLADLPGVEPEAVRVTSEQDGLTITGARRDRLRAGGVPYWLERPTGKLRRSVPLPGAYDRSKIRTQIQDGVLEIRVPKEGSRSRSIECMATHRGNDRQVCASSGATGATPTPKGEQQVVEKAAGSRSAEHPQAARNEALFREANEQVRRLADAGDQSHPGADFICEYSQDTCMERVHVPLATYEAVRGHPRRFIVLPGHENEFEHAVEREDGFLIVEKDGTAGRVAERNDPRS